MRLAAIGVVLLTVGCGKSPATDATETIPLSDVSSELRDIAPKTLPNVKFDSARKKKLNGEDILEIRGKQANGKIREVEVSLSGQVIEVE
jgi:hypothetical protein